MNPSEKQPQTLALPEPSAKTRDGEPEEVVTGAVPATLDGSGLRPEPVPTGQSTVPPSLAPAAANLLEAVPVRAPAGPSIPGYEILGELGHGGMGVVYKAQQLRPRRLVALKVIRTGEYASEKEVARFKAEAEAVAQLNHPNIVPLYEVGEHAGQPYFSLEYIEGGSLDKVLKNTPQPPRDSARLVRALALAMQTAHQATPPIIHRDLKPANILLAGAPRPTGSAVVSSQGGKQTAAEEGASVSVRRGIAEYTPKVTDFGLAKQLDGSGDTVSGTIVGTPEYMAPEQAEGRNRDMDARTDVYALGAILYECLTGRPPFKGATLMDTLEQVRIQEPVPPSRLEPKLPRDLETVCLKCLHKESRRRYASAAELADDLQRYLDGRPVLARPVSSWERALKWARRRPAQAALAAALLAVVLAGGAGALFYGLYKDQQAATLAERLEQRRRADQLSARVYALETRGRAAEDGGRYAEAKQHWDQALATLEASPGADQAELRDRLQEGRQRAERQLEKLAENRALLAERQDFQNRLGPFEQHRDQVLFHAVSLRDQDAAADAAVVRREAPATLEKLGLTVGKKPEALAAGLRRWQRPAESARQIAALAAECYQVLLVWAEAEAVAQPRQALTLLNAAAALRSVHRLPTPRLFHLRRARLLERLGDKTGARTERDRAAAVKGHSALDEFQTALEEFRKRRVKEAAAACEATLSLEADHFWAQYLKALCHLKQQNWESAKVGFQACLGRRSAPPASLLALCGLTHGQLKEFAAAEILFTRALAAADEDSTRAYVRTTRSVVRLKAGRWDDARRDLLAAIDLQPKAYQGHVNLAQAYAGQKQYDLALKALNRALELQQHAVVYYTRARLYAERGDRAAARRDFEQVVARQPLGPGAERLASARVELAHLKHQDRDYKAALEDCEAALRAQPDYAPAHRQRAETLLALGRHEEAGEALDDYLDGGKHSAIIYRARGLVHSRLGEHAEAVEVFSLSLLLEEDGPTRAYRGWEYLALKSPALARRDFEAALDRDARNADALCGRGLARVQLGEDVDKAPGDAEAALRSAKRRTWQLLLNGARIHAQVAGRFRVATDERNRRRVSYHQQRTMELLRETLEQIPPAERAAFWRKNIADDAALRPVRNSEQMQMLARTYSR